MIGLKWLRNRLEKKVIDSLGLPRDRFIIVDVDKDGGSCYHLERKTSFMFGIFPFLHLRKCGWSFSFQEIAEIFVGKLRNFAKDATKLICDSSIGILDSRARQSGEQQLDAIKRKYEEFHVEFVSALVEKARNDFRKKLLELLGTSAAEIFTNNVIKRLEFLLLKLQEKKNSVGAGAQEVTDSNTGRIAMPNGTRFVFRKKDVTVFVVEQIPQIRTVFFKNRGRYQLALPFVVFLVTLKGNDLFGLQVFFRNEPLRESSNELLCPALENVRDDFFVCFPRPDSHPSLPSAMVEATIQNFWGSEFNGDLAAHFGAARSRFPEISSLTTWEVKSRENPEFITHLPWQSAQMSVERAANKTIEAIISGPEQPKDSSTLENFVARLGNELSQGIQEATFFLVPRWVIDEKSLEAGQEKLKALLHQTYKEMRRKLKEDIQTTFSEETIGNSVSGATNQIIRDIEQSFRKDTSRILSHKD